MFVQSLLVALAAIVCYFLHYWYAFTFTCQPIVVGTLIGALLGDLKTGIMCGAQMELIFMGVIIIGSAVPSDVTAGSAVGTAFVIMTGMTIESAIAIAVVAGLLCAQIGTLITTIVTLFNPVIDKLVENDNRKGIYLALIIQTLVSYTVRGICIFVAVYFGADFAQSVVNALPVFVTNGLSVASGMLVAVGLGMLLNIMWNKSNAVFFFVGCVLSVYLNVPVLGVALIGILYAVICYFQSKETSLVQANKNQEELFND